MDSFKLIKDPEYGYLRADPIPSREVIERYYNEVFYSPVYTHFNDSSKNQMEKDREFNGMRYKDIVDAVEAHFGTLEGKSLFDVGCGFGELLKYANGRGLACGGMEVSEEAVEYGRQCGYDIRLADLETDFSEFGGKRYDVVCMLTVLEHLPYPAKVLRSIRENLLAEDGLLVVDVPNDFNPFQVAAAAETGAGNWWVGPPVHLNYFTPETLAGTIEGCGYKVLDTVSSFPMEIFLLMGDNYLEDKELSRKCHLKRVHFEAALRRQGKEKELRAFYRALASLDLGRQVVCYATPNRYSKSYPAVSRENR